MLLMLSCVEIHQGPPTSFNAGKFSYLPWHFSISGSWLQPQVFLQRFWSFRTERLLSIWILHGYQSAGCEKTSSHMRHSIQQWSTVIFIKKSMLHFKSCWIKAKQSKKPFRFFIWVKNHKLEQRITNDCISCGERMNGQCLLIILSGKWLGCHPYAISNWSCEQRLQRKKDWLYLSIYLSYWNCCESLLWFYHWSQGWIPFL